MGDPIISRGPGALGINLKGLSQAIAIAQLVDIAGGVLLNPGQLWHA